MVDGADEADAVDEHTKAPETPRPTVVGRADPTGLSLKAPVGTQNVGGSGSFIAIGSDDEKWRVKPPNTPQGAGILVAELLVSRLGELIDAPVCHVEAMAIGSDHVGWHFRPGQPLAPGYGAASREVADVVEVRGLVHRAEDDNARRHVGVYAIYDWCWGSDDQWLYQGGTGNTLYSHDHGLYLWSGAWGGVDLEGIVGQPHLAAYDATGLDKAKITDTAGRLRAVSLGDIGKIVSEVPVSWPVTDEDLEKLGAFLLKRAPGVADRLEGVAP